MMTTLSLSLSLSLLVVMSCGALAAPAVFSALLEPTTEFRIVVGRVASAAAVAEYEECTSENGWDTLTVSTFANFSDHIQAAAAGFIEGYITHRKIWQNFVNLNLSRSDFAPQVEKFLAENDAFVAAQAAAAPGDPYWQNVVLATEQTLAMWRGYSAAAPASEALTKHDFMHMALDDDLGAIEEAVVPGRARRYEEMPAADLFDAMALQEHCSALVCVAPDLSDLWVAHNTWGSYSHMLRVVKVYRMPLSVAKSPAQIFSGYYGIIFSNDDLYYMEGTRIAVTETTNSNLNSALYKKITPKCVLYWQRVTAANRLATSAKEWAELFGRNPSGTYNNQWMAVDFKLFTPHRPIESNTLWVLEEAPGLVVSSDESRILEVSHWPSFNRPFFAEMYEAMGYPAVAAKYGDLFSYQLNPRANIFRRDAGKISSQEDVRAFIRSNAWKTDPFAYGFPGNTVAGRFDFKGGPETGSPYDGWFRLGLHGARDGKVLSAASTASGLVMDAVNGPAFNGECPPFEWSGQWANVPHLGMPEKYQFGWVSFNATTGSIVF